MGIATWSHKLHTAGCQHPRLSLPVPPLSIHSRRARHIHRRCIFVVTGSLLRHSAGRHQLEWFHGAPGKTGRQLTVTAGFAGWAGLWRRKLAHGKVWPEPRHQPSAGHGRICWQSEAPAAGPGRPLVLRPAGLGWARCAASIPTRQVLNRDRSACWCHSRRTLPQLHR